MKRYTLLLLALLAAGCKDNITTFQESGGYGIAYTQLDLGAATEPTPSIVLLDSLGTHPRTIGPGMILDAANGRVLYAVMNAQAGTLSGFKITSDNFSTSSPANLPSDNKRMSGYSIVLSPSGTDVVYGEFVNGQNSGTLHSAPVTGTSSTVLSTSFNPQTTPAISPDGRSVAYFAIDSAGSNPRIEMVSIAGGTPRVVTAVTNSGVDGYSDIRFNSAGTALVYNTGQDVWTIQADGTNNHHVAQGLHARWSPDGTTLAYTREQLYTTSDGGVTEKALTSTALGRDHVQWSRDGSRLIYSTWVGDYDHATGSLALYDLASGTEKVIGSPCYIGYFTK